MFLTEAQARGNIKELIAYDALKLISVEQENRIDNFQSIVAKYETVVTTKDSIIEAKDGIIDVQEKIINLQNRIKFNGYAGLEFIDLVFDAPTFYFRSEIEFKKMSIGAQISARPIQLYNLPSMYATVRAEWKVF